MIYHKHKLSN